MTDRKQGLLGRRTFVGGAAAGVGLWIARGLGVRGLSAPVESLPFELTLRELGRTMTQRQRQLVVLPSDDPTRQIVNSQSVLDRPHLGTLFSPQQRVLIERLYRTMLSPAGIERFAGTIAVEGRFEGCVFAIYGEPEKGRAQVVLQGGHLMLRGGEAIPGAAFGGGISYGHQAGNGLWRVPGNSFAFHSDAANRLFGLLTESERQRAIVDEPPHELVLQVQGRGAPFAGVRVGDLGESARAQAHDLLEAIFSSYPQKQRSEALSCIAENGGVDSLYFATYATHGFYEDMVAFADLGEVERKQRGTPYWQVWRLEGPGTVLHFKGHPHVHAYIQVVRDPDRVHVGSLLASTRSTIEGAAMRRLLEAALRRASGETLACYGREIPGRFCPGGITTGLAYTLDPYRTRIVVATISGKAMAPDLREHLERSGTILHPQQRYRVVTTDYLAQQTTTFGEPETVEIGTQLLREALVDHLRADGVAAAAA